MPKEGKAGAVQIAVIGHALTLRLRPTICPVITIASAKKNIAEPITLACAGIPRAAEA